MSQRLVQLEPLAVVEVRSRLLKHQRLARNLELLRLVKKLLPPRSAAPSVLAVAELPTVVLAEKLAFRLRKELKIPRRPAIGGAIRIAPPIDLNVRLRTLSLRRACVTSAPTIWTLVTTSLLLEHQSVAVATVVTIHLNAADLKVTSVQNVVHDTSEEIAHREVNGVNRRMGIVTVLRAANAVIVVNDLILWIDLHAVTEEIPQSDHHVVSTAAVDLDEITVTGDLVATVANHRTGVKQVSKIVAAVLAVVKATI